MTAAARRTDRFGLTESRHTSALPKASPQAQPRTLMPKARKDSWSPLRFIIESGIQELHLHDNRKVIFRDDIDARLSKEGGAFHYSIEPLDIHASGPTREAARLAAANAIWEEAHRWLHTQPHTLDRAQRKRRGTFMNLIDIVRSQIAKPLGDFTWVLGRIEPEPSGKHCFRAAKTNGECFDFSPALSNEIAADQFLHMAKLHADNVGNPVGPVVEIGPPLDKDPEATLAAWKRLTEQS